MGFSSMVRAMVRVAAFMAIMCFSLQAACTIGVPRSASGQVETQEDSGCHESAPPAPNAPDSSHICCSGVHSPDALLSAFVTPTPPASGEGVFDLASSLPAFATPATDFPASFSPPHRLLALRI
jgi:hypothetical protein